MAHMNLLVAATILAYALASGCYVAAMISKKAGIGRLGRWLLFAGVVVHAAGFAVRHSAAEGLPVTSLHESLSFFAWCLVLLFLLLDLRFRLSVMGAFAAPAALVLMIFSLLSPDVVVPVNPVLRTWLFPIHITFAFLGNAAFALSFGAGVMYLVQDRMLRSKRFNRLYQMLPSIDILDRVNYTCLSIGFPLMTVGIISGAVWANIAWGSYWSWDPKETWALVTWFLYAGLLHGRLTIGWRGRRAAVFSIIAFAFLLFTFIGVSLLFDGYHSFDAFTLLSQLSW